MIVCLSSKLLSAGLSTNHPDSTPQWDSSSHLRSGIHKAACVFMHYAWGEAKHDGKLHIPVLLWCHQPPIGDFTVSHVVTWPMDNDREGAFVCRCGCMSPVEWRNAFLEISESHLHSDAFTCLLSLLSCHTRLCALNCTSHKTRAYKCFGFFCQETTADWNWQELDDQINAVVIIGASDDDAMWHTKRASHDQSPVIYYVARRAEVNLDHRVQSFEPFAPPALSVPQDTTEGPTGQSNDRLFVVAVFWRNWRGSRMSCHGFKINKGRRNSIIKTCIYSMWSSNIMI